MKTGINANEFEELLEYDLKQYKVRRSVVNSTKFPTMKSLDR